MKNAKIFTLLITGLCLGLAVGYAILGNIGAMFGFMCTSVLTVGCFYPFRKQHRKVPRGSFKGLDWDAPADPTKEADNYFLGTVTDKLMESDTVRISAILYKKWLDDWNNQGDYINGALTEAKRLQGKPLTWTRGEALISFMAFKLGEYTGALHARYDAEQLEKGIKEINTLLDQWAEDNKPS